MTSTNLALALRLAKAGDEVEAEHQALLRDWHAARPEARARFLTDIGLPPSKFVITDKPRATVSMDWNWS